MATEKAQKTKPQPRRVPSDDFEIEISGEVYYPHLGESIWIVGQPTIGELKATWGFNRISVELDDVAADPPAEGEAPDEVERRQRDSRVKAVQLVENHYDDLLAWIAPRLSGWDWTDNDSNPLPQPDRTPAPLQCLTPDELFYIRSVLRGEGPAEVGNADSTSATTS